ALLTTISPPPLKANCTRSPGPTRSASQTFRGSVIRPLALILVAIALPLGIGLRVYSGAGTSGYRRCADTLGQIPHFTFWPIGLTASECGAACGGPGLVSGSGALPRVAAMG